MTPPKTRPTAKEISIAAICLFIGVGGAFLAASLTKGDAIFSLSPPGSGDGDTFGEWQRLDLHRAFFTVWAAMILVTPALCTFLFRRSSESAARYWQAFWTVSFLAFLVHFYWSVVVLFNNDWGRILGAHKRVSAPIPDTIFTVWWGLDVLLAWLTQSERGWIRVQRILVHIAAFGLFFSGSAFQGEIFWSKALGIAMGVAVLASSVYWIILKKAKPMIPEIS